MLIHPFSPKTAYNLYDRVFFNCQIFMLCTENAAVWYMYHIFESSETCWIVFAIYFIGIGSALFCKCYIFLTTKKRRTIGYIELVTALIKPFRNNFISYENFSIEQSVLLFKNRLHFNQYIPSKRSRFGTKAYLCVWKICTYLLNEI